MDDIAGDILFLLDYICKKTDILIKFVLSKKHFLENPVITLILSLILGIVFGWLGFKYIFSN